MRLFNTFSDGNVEIVHGLEDAGNYIVEEIEAIQSDAMDEETRTRLNNLRLMLDEVFCEVNEIIKENG